MPGTQDPSPWLLAKNWKGEFSKTAWDEETDMMVGDITELSILGKLYLDGVPDAVELEPDFDTTKWSWSGVGTVDATVAIETALDGGYRGKVSKKDIKFKLSLDTASWQYRLLVDEIEVFAKGRVDGKKHEIRTIFSFSIAGPLPNTGYELSGTTPSGSGKFKLTPQLSKLNPVKQTSKPRRFSSCREAALAVGSEDLALTTANLKPTIRSNTIHGDSRVLLLSWEVDFQTSNIDFPKWTWPNMSTADKAAWKQFADALLAHEIGHVTVASVFARHISRLAIVIPKSNSQKDAINEFLEKSRAELDNFTKVYDTVTDHGCTQSAGPAGGFPGGADVVLKCPHS